MGPCQSIAGNSLVWGRTELPGSSSWTSITGEGKAPSLLPVLAITFRLAGPQLKATCINPLNALYYEKSIHARYPNTHFLLITAPIPNHNEQPHPTSQNNRDRPAQPRVLQILSNYRPYPLQSYTHASPLLHSVNAIPLPPTDTYRRFCSPILA